MAIKSTLVTPPNKAKEIDWDTPRIVQCTVTGIKTILATTGDHTDKGFSGVVLYSDRTEHLKDTFWGKWDKESFTPITTPITITFENE